MIDDRIRLNYLELEQQLLRFAGGDLTLHREKLTVIYSPGVGHQSRDAVVDTGAVLTLFPELIWKGFKNEITWCENEEKHLGDWLCYVNPVINPRAKGKRIRCRIGQVLLLLLDLDGRTMGPISLIAKCAFDDGAIKQTLFGLGGGSLNGRKLVVDHDVHLAWLIATSSSSKNGETHK